MRAIVTLVFLMAFLISPANAAGLTGNWLQDLCSSPEGSGKNLACTAYIGGFIAGVDAGEGTKRKDTRVWCFPTGSTVGQARLIIEKYMRDNPQSLHQETAIIVGKALLSAFPCKNSN